MFDTFYLDNRKE